jgi:hypothetical protein
MRSGPLPNQRVTRRCLCGRFLAAVEQGAAEELDRYLMIVTGGGTKSGQIGSAFALALAKGIQSTEADDQVAESGQVAGQMTGASRRAVLVKADIPHIMDGVFDAPMGATEFLSLGGVHSLRRTAAQDDFDVFGDSEALEVMGGSDDDRGLGGMREASTLGSDGEGMDLASFMPAVALVQGDVRRGKNRP